MSATEQLDARTQQLDFAVETNSCVGSDRPDPGLLESVAAGNVEAFEMLYGQYGGIVYAMCKYKLSDACDASKVQSDIFL